ncbi:MAG: ribokinase [SAR86 cluster bacterium]|jgi:ribokinase
MSEALVFGGVNLDQVVYLSRPPKEGETLEGENIETFLGGKGANQAVALSRLGASVSFVGNVGRDSFGEELTASLSSEGIDLSMLGSVNKKTGTALINVFENSENQIIYIPGANKLTSHKQATSESLEAANIIVSQMEVNPKEVEQLFANSKNKNCINILNLAPFKEPSNTLIAHTDILVFNELEFSLFTSLDTSIPLELDSLKEKLENLNLNHKLSLIVTLGERGLVYYENHKMDYIEAVKVNAVDTVGSGDCFVGALSYSLLQGRSLEESCEFANKSAALSVTKKGAATSMPKMEEVRSFYKL